MDARGLETNYEALLETREEILVAGGRGGDAEIQRPELRGRQGKLQLG